MTTLKTARLTLRPFTLDDVAAYHAAILSDPDTMKFLPGGKTLSPDEARTKVQRFIDHWTQHGLGYFAVIYQNELIGHAGLGYLPGIDSEIREVEIGYAIARKYAGQGLATEAATACLNYGFETLNLPRIVAVFVPENLASRRVMEKIGMTYEKTALAYNALLPWYVIQKS